VGKLVLGMNVSLDGYVDDAGGNLVMGVPSPKLFAWWIEAIRGVDAELLGRRMYEVMRYWDDDRPEWDAPQREFADLWRRIPKYVVSTTLSEVGPNATLISGDIAARVRDLKARTEGEINVSGPQLAGLMTERGLVDEYQLVVRPYVLGAGKPFFHAARPKLRLVSSRQIDDETMVLIYAPA
jgi:dihydrofolate reductase